MTPDLPPIPPTGPCNLCSRPSPLRTILEGTVRSKYPTPKVEPFRVGYYLCRWHQGHHTRWKRAMERRTADAAH